LQLAEQSGTLLVALPTGARLNSETVGSMIDRLSIFYNDINTNPARLPALVFQHHPHGAFADLG
jgi:hypothetical protein